MILCRPDERRITPGSRYGVTVSPSTEIVSRERNLIVTSGSPFGAAHRATSVPLAARTTPPWRPMLALEAVEALVRGSPRYWSIVVAPSWRLHATSALPVKPRSTAFSFPWTT